MAHSYTRDDIPLFNVTRELRRGPGPRRHQRFVLPRPVEWVALQRIAQDAASLVDRHHLRYFHIIAIAKSGYPLASSLCVELAGRHPEARGFLSGVDTNSNLNAFELPEQTPEGVLTILVDNSVNTGSTAIRALEILEECAIKPTYFLKMIDYQDRLETETTTFIASRFDIDVCSAYSRAEVIRRIKRSAARVLS